MWMRGEIFSQTIGVASCLGFAGIIQAENNNVYELHSNHMFCFCFCLVSNSIIKSLTQNDMV